MDVWLSFRTGNRAESTSQCIFVDSSGRSANERKLGVVLPRNNIPQKDDSVVRFVVISDTHSRHAELGTLPPGDIFIHCGDILMSSRLWSPGGRVEKYEQFNEWLGSGAIQCPTWLVIGGNHDKELADLGKDKAKGLLSNAFYLENEVFVWSSPSTGPVSIFGAPLSSGRSGNSAFQGEPSLKATYDAAAQAASTENPVVLMTHASNSDLRPIFKEERLRAHFWGHAHGHHGAELKALKGGSQVLSVCASIMDTQYRPLQLPFVVDVRF